MIYHPVRGRSSWLDPPGYDWRIDNRYKAEGVEGMMMDTDNDVWHTMTATIGVKAIRDKKGNIRSVGGIKIWKDRPEFIDRDVRLLRVNIEIPESFFGFEAEVRGRIESKLTEEFTALVEELTDES